MKCSKLLHIFVFLLQNIAVITVCLRKTLNSFELPQQQRNSICVFFVFFSSVSSMLHLIRFNWAEMHCGGINTQLEGSRFTQKLPSADTSVIMSHTMYDSLIHFVFFVLNYYELLLLPKKIKLKKKLYTQTLRHTQNVIK